MDVLTGKTILLISPQAWGKMFISKHHYALELAKRGNRVYFLNPPEMDLEGKSVDIKPSGINENLWLINHRLFFPFEFKFHALTLFHFLVRWQVKKILREIGREIDIVWSFDIENLYPFKLFPETSFKIYQPVDDPSALNAILAANGADIIFSVTQEIVDKFKHLKIHGYFINHGLSAEFLSSAVASVTGKEEIHVGFSGNLLRPDQDRPTLLRIVKENPEVIFEFWGSYLNADSNISGGEDDEQRAFIRSLVNFSNVKLHGPKPVKELAESFREMEAFLICYDIEKDQSKGTNYHKVLEFMASGKVIISNNISTYKDRKDLVMMTDERQSNSGLPDLFREIISHLQVHNSEEKRQARIAYAKEHTYPKQLDKISRIILLDNKETFPS